MFTSSITTPRKGEGEDIATIEFDEGKPEEAYLSRWEIRESDRDPKFLDQLETKYRKKWETTDVEEKAN